MAPVPSDLMFIAAVNNRLAPPPSFSKPIRPPPRRHGASNPNLSASENGLALARPTEGMNKNRFGMVDNRRPHFDLPVDHRFCELPHPIRVQFSPEFGPHTGIRHLNFCGDYTHQHAWSSILVDFIPLLLVMGFVVRVVVLVAGKTKKASKKGRLIDSLSLDTVGSAVTSGVDKVYRKMGKLGSSHKMYALPINNVGTGGSKPIGTGGHNGCIGTIIGSISALGATEAAKQSKDILARFAMSIFSDHTSDIYTEGPGGYPNTVPAMTRRRDQEAVCKNGRAWVLYLTLAVATAPLLVPTSAAKWTYDRVVLRESSKNRACRMKYGVLEAKLREDEPIQGMGWKCHEDAVYLRRVKKRGKEKKTF